MKIIGAGLSGLIAANVFRRHHPIIVESQKDLPNNHEALLRFRDMSVSDATAIPFKKVRVYKAINYDGEQFTKPTIKLANMYAQKVSGMYHQRSIWNLDPVDRYIAPSNFIRQIAHNVRIQYDTTFDFEMVDHDPIISTIPMFALMNALEYPSELIPEFSCRPIWSVSFDMSSPDVDLYQTVYYPNPGLDMYRLSITGNHCIAEFINPIESSYQHGGREWNIIEYIEHFLSHDFGIQFTIIDNVKVKEQKFGKLLPREEEKCKRFIQWATDTHNVYSLGRWATHRQILLDEVVDDALKIQRMISTNNYSR